MRFLLFTSWSGGIGYWAHPISSSSIFCFICNFYRSKWEILLIWRDTQPFLAFIPDSAKDAERALFIGNVMLLLTMQSNQYTSNSSCTITLRNMGDSVDSLLRFVIEQYADPGLSLKKLSNSINLSERHLGRTFKKLTNRSFRQYLRDLRIKEAARLLISFRI